MQQMVQHIFSEHQEQLLRILESDFIIVNKIASQEVVELSDILIKNRCKLKCKQGRKLMEL